MSVLQIEIQTSAFSISMLRRGRGPSRLGRFVRIRRLQGASDADRSGLAMPRGSVLAQIGVYSVESAEVERNQASTCLAICTNSKFSLQMMSTT